MKTNRDEPAPSVATVVSGSPSSSMPTGASPPAGGVARRLCGPCSSAPSAGTTTGAPGAPLFTVTALDADAPEAVVAVSVWAPLSSVVVSRSAARPVVAAGSCARSNVRSAESTREVLVPHDPSPNA